MYKFEKHRLRALPIELHPQLKGMTGLEPATSGLTGQFVCSSDQSTLTKRRRRDLNPHPLDRQSSTLANWVTPPIRNILWSFFSPRYSAWRVPPVPARGTALRMSNVPVWALQPEKQTRYFHRCSPQKKPRYSLLRYSGVDLSYYWVFTLSFFKGQQVFPTTGAPYPLMICAMKFEVIITDRFCHNGE